MSLPKYDAGILVFDAKVESLVAQRTRGHFSARSLLGLVAATPNLDRYLAGILMSEGLLCSLRGKQGLDERLAVGVSLRPEDSQQDTFFIEQALSRLVDKPHRTPVSFIEWHPMSSMARSTRRPDSPNARFLAAAARATQARGLVPLLNLTSLSRSVRDDDGADEHEFVRALSCELAASSVDTKGVILRHAIPPDRMCRAPEETTNAFRLIEQFAGHGLSYAFFTSENAGLKRMCSHLALIQTRRREGGALWRAGFASGRELLAGVLDGWDGNLRSQLAQSRLTSNCRAAAIAIAGPGEQGFDERSPHMTGLDP